MQELQFFTREYTPRDERGDFYWVGGCIPQKIIMNLTRTYVIDAEKKNHIDLVVSGTVQTDTQTAILFLLYNHNHLDQVHYGRKEELY